MKFLALALMLCALNAGAAYNTITVVFTNIPATGNTITRNGSAAIWTNGPINTTAWIQTNGLAGSATNLTRFLGANNQALYTRQQNSTNVLISGTDLTVSITGTWGYLVTNSLTATNQWGVVLPFDNQFATNRTNTADELIYGINAYARTGSFSAGAQALTNFFNRSTAQTGGNKTLTNSVLQGGTTNSYHTNITYANASSLVATTATIYTLANTLSNASLEAPKLTNFTGRGTGLFVSNVIGIDVTLTNLSAPGSGTRSLRIGSSSAASNDDTVALGTSTTSSGVGSIAVGNGSVASNAASISIGTTALTKGDGGIAIGTASATNYAVAIGDSSEALYSFSTAIGTLAIATTNNQVRIGTADEHVSIPGQLRAANQTNSVFLGTNNWNGDVAYNAHAYSSLVNSPTVNSAIPIGTNYYADLSGATAIADIHSFENRRVGYTFTAVFSGHITNRLIHNSGSEATAAMRINTGTGANVSQTNQPAWARFRKRSGDWLLLEYSN